MKFRPMVFRPTSSIVLAVVVLAFCALMIVATAFQGSPEALLRSAGAIGLLSVLAVAVFWLPKLDVREDEIIVRNVFTTVRVPWEAIVSIESRWSLVFRTERGKVTAWASPPASQSVGVGFLIRGMTPRGPVQPSGDAASGKMGVTQTIQTHWDFRTDRDGIDPGAFRAHRSFNVLTIAVLAVLAVAALAGLLI